MARMRDRFSVPAIVLHWTIAGLLLFNIWLGWQFDDAKGLIRFNEMQLHKSVGITVLALSLIRLGLRLVIKPPPLPAQMPRWEKIAALTTHWAFYVVMIGLPLTGWAIVSASPTNIPTLLYKHIPWPHLGFIHDMAMPARKSAEKAFTAAHHLLGKLTYALILLHVGAALKHQFVNRDAVLWRMLPLWPKPKDPT
ncbi:MAG: cytochrome b [Caulobacteraceae bacterium]|nr:cytochrome b [Caulobacteraceae bacterium]